MYRAAGSCPRTEAAHRVYGSLQSRSSQNSKTVDNSRNCGARHRPLAGRRSRKMINGEKVLVARHSAFQAILLTENESGLRTLRFGSDGAFQSVLKVGDPRHLEMPYARVLPACLAFARNPLRVLIVGLGGGTLPRFFHSHFPQMLIDVVELDRDVLEVAKEYCGFEEDARMRVYVDDGRDFIEGSPGGYDLIILDSFGDESIPTHLATLEFLKEMRERLGHRGNRHRQCLGASDKSSLCTHAADLQGCVRRCVRFRRAGARHQALRRTSTEAIDESG